MHGHHQRNPGHAELGVFLRQQHRGGGIGRGHDHIRVGRAYLEHRRCHVVDVGGNPLHRHHLCAHALGNRLGNCPVGVAKVIVVSDVGNLLSLELLDREFHDGAADRALGTAEGAEHITRRGKHRHVTSGIQHDQREFLARGELLRCRDRCTAGAAVGDEGLVNRRQLLHHCDHFGRVALVVLDDDFDLAAVDAALLVDFLVPHLGGLYRVEPEGCQLAGHRAEHTDGDLGVGNAHFGCKGRRCLHCKQGRQNGHAASE